MKADLGYIILAAGKGTRMHSESPKVLQRVLGKPLLGYVYAALEQTPAVRIWTVIGFQAEDVRALFPDQQFIYQAEQLGTGHAVLRAWPHILKSGLAYVCVLNGDTPHVPVEEISRLTTLCQEKDASMGVLTLTLDNPHGYGRIRRDHSGKVEAIVEEKDFCLLGQEEIHEVNSGVYVFNVHRCAPLLTRINQGNTQQEFYLTQMVALCAQAGFGVATLPCVDDGLLRGVNSPQELVGLEETLRGVRVVELLRSGVLLRRPESIVIGPDVHIAPGADIAGPCEIYGQSYIEAGACIDSHCWIKDSSLGPCQVKSFSHIEGARIHGGACVGPYARLRPGSDIGVHARVGNFVEVKNSVFHEGAKAGHLSYLGDSEIGADVNIGAGTITCNYDGERKHQTRIQPGAFIGSNTALVAPVVVGRGALVAAGSVITKDVPEESLAVARARQVNLPRKRTKKKQL